MGFNFGIAQNKIIQEDQNCRIEFIYSGGKKKKRISCTKVNTSDSTIFVYGERDKVNYRIHYRKALRKVSRYFPENHFDFTIWFDKNCAPATHAYFPILELKPGESYTETYSLKNDSKVQTFAIFERYFFQPELWAFSSGCNVNSLTDYGNFELANQHSTYWKFVIKF